MFEWIVLVIVVAVIIVICEVRIGKSKEFFEKEKRSIESMWKARIENEHNLQDEVRKGLKSDLPIDMLEIDIKNIWTILGEIIGETYTEELLDNLFKDFCVGK